MKRQFKFDYDRKEITVLPGFLEVSPVDMYLELRELAASPEQSDVEWSKNPALDAFGNFSLNKEKTLLTPIYVFMSEYWTIVINSKNPVVFKGNLYTRYEAATKDAKVKDMFLLINKSTVSIETSDDIVDITPKKALQDHKPKTPAKKPAPKKAS